MDSVALIRIVVGAFVIVAGVRLAARRLTGRDFVAEICEAAAAGLRQVRR